MNTSSSDTHTPTVLLVEDDEPTRLAMASWLAAEGFLTTQSDAKSADFGVIAAASKPPKRS